MPMPEHNGFGSEADSYMNCISLIPKAPLKDFYKFIFKDGKVLQISLNFNFFNVDIQCQMLQKKIKIKCN
jgi:hypothetical protein